MRIPVLAVFGEYDWIITRHRHELIVDWVNRNKAGLVSSVQIPRMDHFYMVHQTRV